MQQIAELERRITAALERIGRGVETLASPQVAPPAASADDIIRLTEALDEERMANAQLNERLRVVRDKDAAAKAVVVAQLEASEIAREEQSAEIARLRQTVADLETDLAELRLTAPDPQQQTKAMMAELDALRAARAAEVTELAEILAALNPLIEEARPNA